MIRRGRTDVVYTSPEDRDAAYAAIERALRETERGRWFLEEYARRQRKAETQTLLEALSRFESALGVSAKDGPAPAARASAKPAPPPRPAGPDPRLAAFARIEALPFEERLALFS